MSAFYYNCLCGTKSTFDVIDYKELKCLKCGRVITVKWNYITNGFEISLKEGNVKEAILCR